MLLFGVVNDMLPARSRATKIGWLPLMFGTVCANEVAQAAAQLPRGAPVGRVRAGHIARANHQVGVIRGREQRRQVMRIVGEVGVHRDDAVDVAFQGVAEAGHVGGGQGLLAAPVQHRQRVVLGGQGVGQLPRPTGRGIVDDEDRGLRQACRG
jgi:hypothetical protein